MYSVCTNINSPYNILIMYSINFVYIHYLQVDLDSKLGKSLIITRDSPQSQTGGYEHTVQYSTIHIYIYVIYK